MQNKGKHLEAGDYVTWETVRYRVMGVDRHWWYALVQVGYDYIPVHMDKITLKSKGQALSPELKRYRNLLGGEYAD